MNSVESPQETIVMFSLNLTGMDLIRISLFAWVVLMLCLLMILLGQASGEFNDTWVSAALVTSPR